MNQPLDDLYLTWLYNHIADSEDTNKSRSFWKLARQLYIKEFIWWVPNDDNRVEDGKYLREIFIDDQHLENVDPDWLELDCSMLEMLIGLSMRLSFLGEGEPIDWFWRLIDNVGLRYSDRGNYPESFINEVLDNIIWRVYKFSGSGGLFPLRHPERDQREVEIWYQMNAYLLERN